MHNIRKRQQSSWKFRSYFDLPETALGKCYFVFFVRFIFLTVTCLLSKNLLKNFQFLRQIDKVVVSGDPWQYNRSL